MKKTLLILLILSCSLFKTVSGQEPDTPTESGKVTRWRSMSFYVGILPGFEVYKSDSANVTTAFPYGVNYRIYSKSGKSFIDMDLCGTAMILNQHDYTTFIKPSVGYGMISRLYNFQFHFSYYISPLKYKNMLGIGYDVEAQAIPISIELFYVLPDLKQYFLLVGIKVPILILSK